MATKTRASFDTKTFLAKAGKGRSIVKCRKDDIVFSQGDPADAVFYVQKGRVKITVVSLQGKEAVIALLGSDEFFGEGCLSGQPRRMATVRALAESSIMRIEKAALARLIRDEPEFSAIFMAHVLARSLRLEEDLVDQLFNSSEKRLARLLLLLANFGKDQKPEPVIAKISQEMLAEMIGTTRACKLFHEQISEAWLHQIQWRHRGSHLLVERDPPRSAAERQLPRAQATRRVKLLSCLPPITRS